MDEFQTTGSSPAFSTRVDRIRRAPGLVASGRERLIAVAAIHLAQARQAHDVAGVHGNDRSGGGAGAAIFKPPTPLAEEMGRE